MGGDQTLDLRHARAALVAGDDAPVVDQQERRNHLHAEALRELGAAAGAAAGVGAGLGLDTWDEAVGGGAGGLVGALAAAPLVTGSLRRGGTRGGTAALLGVGGLLLAAFALVPALGYVEAVALPL